VVERGVAHRVLATELADRCPRLRRLQCGHDLAIGNRDFYI
jgi:hypothetical protein